MQTNGQLIVAHQKTTQLGPPPRKILLPRNFFGTFGEQKGIYIIETKP